MRLAGLAALGVLAACATEAVPAPTQSPALSLGEILEQSPAADWRAVDPENTLYMELPAGRVIIELAPAYAPDHTANIRALVRAGYFNGAAIVRSQDNYVVQWGRDEADPAPMGEGRSSLPAEFDRTRAGVDITRLRDPDSYASEVGFAGGFPVASNGSRTWLAHCYGMVGAGRGDTSDSGSGAELYVVIGHAPRHLDRNVTLVGRSYGMLLGILAALGIRHEEVRAQKWQSSLGCLSGGNKNITKAKCQQLFPFLKANHAISDAVLIAENARRTMKAR